MLEKMHTDGDSFDIYKFHQKKNKEISSDDRIILGNIIFDYYNLKLYFLKNGLFHSFIKYFNNLDQSSVLRLYLEKSLPILKTLNKKNWERCQFNNYVFPNLEINDTLVKNLEYISRTINSIQSNLIKIDNTFIDEMKETLRFIRHILLDKYTIRLLVSIDESKKCSDYKIPLFDCLPGNIGKELTVKQFDEMFNYFLKVADDTVFSNYLRHLQIFKSKFILMYASIQNNLEIIFNGIFINYFLKLSKQYMFRISSDSTYQDYVFNLSSENKQILIKLFGDKKKEIESHLKEKLGLKFMSNLEQYYKGCDESSLGGSKKKKSKKKPKKSSKKMKKYKKKKRTRNRKIKNRSKKRKTYNSLK